MKRFFPLGEYVVDWVMVGGLGLHELEKGR